MTRTHHGRIIETSVRIRTSPQKAWEAWADPQQIANWFVDRAEGQAKAGSTMKWFFDTLNYQIPVPIIEAVPGRTFVTGSGDQPGPDGLPYLMEITITKDGGDTVMNLVNSGFSESPDKDENFRGVESGWTGALTTMKVWLERYPECTRRHEIVMQPANYDQARLRPLYATADGRRRWLEPDIPADSEVLCDTGTEVLLAWPANAALVGLKAFPVGPQRVLALDYSQWRANGAGVDEETRGRMRRALDRLIALL